ncbi:exodeoxyribonuclease III [Myceligenerans salitolerans]|uniref:exodeoxyribonuclease III n=1 Tax=Myceligenerans salitolerans TaxID=1230528 RepID=UPI0027DE39D4|nr:exodeoxyribonuclease III [Myceligenerans salitolerans]
MPELTVATANVNGIRAAFRRGMDAWVTTRKPDVLLLQEVRAPQAVVEQHLDGWHVANLGSELKGRAGVLVASRHPVVDVRRGLPWAGDGPEAAVHTGRWIEADIALPGDAGTLTAVSTYQHSGSTKPGEEATMEAKYAYLERTTARLAELATAGTPAVVAGDVNIAHTRADIKNWKGNLNSAGFLPAERAYLDRWSALGWTDLGRAHGGDGPGPYTWWSWRGKAFDNDAGWRIDYQYANPALAPACRKVEVDRAPSYAERWSDHAPVVAVYEL